MIFFCYPCLLLACKNYRTLYDQIVEDVSLTFYLCAKSFLHCIWPKIRHFYTSDMKLRNNMIGLSTSVKYLGLSFISFHFILFVYSIRRSYATGKR